MKKSNEVYETDIHKLMLEISNKLWLIVICCVLAAAAAYGITKYYITPVYQSTAKIIIMKKDSDISYKELYIATLLKNDYEKLIVSRRVLNEVIENLSLQISYESLKDEINIVNPTNTHILKITVTNQDSETAKKIADSICNVSASKIVEILGVEQVNIIENGNIPSVPSSPNLYKNLTIAVLIGLATSCGIIMIIFINNDKIRSPEDIKKYLNLSVLGVIPFSKTSGSSKNYGAYFKMVFI